MRSAAETSSDELSPDELASDELWMEEALRCAQRALEAGEVPVGAVVVCAGRVVGRGWNRNLADCDPTAHAEIVALREAGRNLGNYRLGECELFATIEPCAMCAGAAVHARVRRLVYGAEDPKAGAVHSILQVVNHPSLNHRMEIRGGVLAGRSAELVQEFFRKRRWLNTVFCAAHKCSSSRSGQGTASQAAEKPSSVETGLGPVPDC